MASGRIQRRSRLDEWFKEVAPTNELRKWFDHDPDKFDEFSKRYKGELTEREEPVGHLLKIAEEQKVTLLYAAKDEEYNHVNVLKNFFRRAQYLKLY